MGLVAVHEEAVQTTSGAQLGPPAQTVRKSGAVK